MDNDVKTRTVGNTFDVLNGHEFVYFPMNDTVLKPRPTQTELVRQTLQMFAEGKEGIVVCAPTGSGKTAYGLWMIDMLLDHLVVHVPDQTSRNECSRKKLKGVYTSPLNTLVDQMDEQYGIHEVQIHGEYRKGKVFTLKGREHYKCLAGKTDCSLGYCQVNVCTMDNTLPRKIIGKDGKATSRCSSCAEMNNSRWLECPCVDCIYRTVRSKFSETPIGNINFALFEMGISGDRDIVVIDECDDIEGFIRIQNTLIVDEYIDSDDFGYHIETLGSLVEQYEADLSQCNEDTTYLSDKQKLYFTRKVAGIKKLLADYEAHKKHWCISHPEGSTKTMYQPVTVQRFLAPLLKDRFVIMMSATPRKIPDYGFIEIDSEFPVENRPWVYLPIARMGSDHRAVGSQKIALLLKHLEGKTLVHCHSYGIARMIYEALRVFCPGRDILLQTSGKLSMGDQYARKDVVQKFKDSKDPDAVFLSVNMARGTDFPEADIVNNVITKMPWYDYRDPLVKAKNAEYGGTGWQHVDYAGTLMQAYGRLPRRPDKESLCIIADADFNNHNMHYWYGKHLDLFYKWFKEAQLYSIVAPDGTQGIEYYPWLNDVLGKVQYLSELIEQ